MLNRERRGFEASLFNMAPKGAHKKDAEMWSFETSLFNMAPKVRFITTLNAFSVFIFIKIWHTIIMNKVD